MPYLIDGHNLIPKLGLSLRSMDDETELISRLQTFCRVERKQVEVFFDGAPAGQIRTKRFGLVTAHFIRLGQTADSAIRARLNSLGRTTHSWTVVTSDRQVQVDARAKGALVISSDTFAGMVIESMRTPAESSTGEMEVSDLEVEEWMRIFRENKR